MKNAVVSWSSGKDSAMAFHRVCQNRTFAITSLLTTLQETDHRVSAHNVRASLVRAQADRLGLPLHEIYLPRPCPNTVYEARIGSAVEKLRAEKGIEDHIFGDLFLQDIRNYREKNLKTANLQAHFPLWGENTYKLADEMIALGIEAYIVAINLDVMPANLCGVRFDKDFLNTLPPNIDPCGENGEFHTVVTNMMHFSSPIEIVIGGYQITGNHMYADFRIKGTEGNRK